MSGARGRLPRVGRTRVPAGLLIACALLVVFVGSWALWPLGKSRVEAPEYEGELSSAPREAAVTLDIDAFKAPIWVAAAPPPAPPPAAAPPPPPAPLRVQLLAILHEGDGHRAAMYDPDSDRLVVVRTGDRVAGRLVDAVDSDRVALRDDRGTRMLTLRDGGGVP